MDAGRRKKRRIKGDEKADSLFIIIESYLVKSLIDELGLLIQMCAKRTEVASKFNSFCRTPKFIYVC
jgi:hypothetical protein